MAVTPAQENALLDTQRAFDTVAPTYDRANARNPVLCEIRRRTVSAVAERVPSGSSLLDLGCGPGPDAEYFARMGHRVVAIDWSASMVRETSRRIQAAGLQDRVEVLHLGIHELDRLAPAPSTQPTPTSGLSTASPTSTTRRGGSRRGLRRAGSSRLP